MSWFGGWLRYQITDMSRVRPHHNVTVMSGKFITYLNSPAGLIKFVSKTERDFTNFRDKYVNKFEGVKSRKEFFVLYREIRKKHRVKWSANFRTRCQNLWC
jgi:hypothetical protein